MNIIDKNGRLFGKINIIDLSVVLILLFAIPVFMFGYKAMTARDDMQKTWVTVKMKVLRVIPELAEVMQSEDVETEYSGRKIGTLVKIDSLVPSATLALANDPTRLTMVNDPVTKDVIVMLRLLCKDNLGFLYYKNFSIKIGNALTFSTNAYDITGTIIKVDRKQSVAQ